jgi:nitrogen permease regulator 3-like protein
MFHDVVRWMLQRDLLVTLHLRVRTVVVPAALKARVRRRRDEQRDRGWHTEEEGAFRSRSRRRHKVRADSGVGKLDLELFDPSPAWYMRCNAGAVDPPILDEGIDLDEEIEKEKGEAEEAEAEVEAAKRRVTMGHQS